MATEPINFRPTAEVLAWIDEACDEQQRSRSSLLNAILARVLDRERPARLIAQYVKLIHDADAGYDREGGNYRRGALLGAKTMLSALLGEGIKDRALDDARASLKLPIPTVIPADQNGDRIGFDLDATSLPLQSASET